MKWYPYNNLVIIMSAIFIAVLLTVRVITTDMPVLDEWSSPFVDTLQGTTLFVVFRWITELGSGTFIAPFLVVFAVTYYYFSKNLIASIMIPLGALLGYRANHWIKILIERERPSLLPEAEGVGFSFPSGHAMGAMIAYGLVIHFLTVYLKNDNTKLTLQIVGVVLIVLIGMSRYVIRVHYLTDVVAGFAFGFLFLATWIGFYNRINNYVSNK
ncbi:phosphatidylglycerophosphatase B [Paraliobacillus quinghaiensis]|uniref:Phosphatidylglycerophosphatase B n=1 Tax=Paraliobacillus quinghaiensis TaxID=470815 RepID=A0A917TK32_9BACI|nr:phosphatase PAP2 family protein [Paraliobacillus quinghaiensis]GGM25401.1 phosphatidylglycerophosphatase B [Paraliobacillus quinghaiensis]